MEKKNLKILVIIVLSLVVLLIIAAVKFNILKKLGFKKLNQSNFNVTIANNINSAQGEKYEKVVDASKKENANDKLTLMLKEGSLSNSGAVFVLENKSDKVYTYGAEYDIEVKTDNGWEKVEDSRNKAWTQVLYVSEPNKTNNIAVDFSELKNKLVSGKHYRVVKRLIEEVGGNKEYYLNAEFQMR